MKIHRLFDDLGEFVAAFRGGISREAIRLDLDERHVPGTVLEIDLALADGLSLVSGRAAVVDVRQAPSHAIASWRTVLRFASLDPESRDFLERFERRQDAEGEPVFRPDLGPTPPDLEAQPDIPPGFTDTGALEVAFLDLARKPTVRERAAPIEERGRGAGRGSNRGGFTRRLVWAVGVVAVAASVAAAVWTFRPDLLGAGSTEPSEPANVTRISDPAPDPTPPPTTPVPVDTPTSVATPVSAAPGGLRATGLTWSVEDGATVVRITTDRSPSPGMVQRFRMDNDPGPREVVVIRGAQGSDLPLRKEVGDPRLERVRTWLHADRTPPELHVVLDLTDIDVTADEPAVDGPTVTVRIR